jgi:glucokinase
MNNKDQSGVIGIDIGGTKISAGVVLWPSAQIVRHALVPTGPQRGGEAVLQDTLALAASLMDWSRAQGIVVTGIGAAVAELVDPDGNVTSSQTIQWQGLPARQRLSAIAPAHIESDVRAAALGEALCGAGKSSRLFVYITVGTGISYCLVQDGRPFMGARGNAIVLASSPLSTTCSHCGQRLRPVLEEFASGPALVKRYLHSRAEHASRGDETREIVARAEAVFRLAETGDAAALEVIESAGEALGVSAGFLVNVLDPELVIVGGGLGLAGGPYWEAFIQATREHIWSAASRDLPIVTAKLAEHAGVIGAAASFITRDRTV